MLQPRIARRFAMSRLSAAYRRFVPLLIGRPCLFSFLKLAQTSFAVIATAMIAFTIASTMFVKQQLDFTPESWRRHRLKSAVSDHV
ncbi:hypothetical protein H9L14_02960 [Sphingomonas sediminicola]|uniref:Uncharacterized protein n=1 Tax=Sphingomonas sediminicola TaxID=386874 RepID=A0ABX6TF45_9SPHN|nr:hypothetical protein [Sphingomonas sediminicola]QNP46218.1 hypothetical protein H9L14_02960 [Sphingomonas sediminicola]